MRQIILDTETTGLAPEEGHRIIEIGCLELQHRRLTERRFHCYLNPERDVEQGAVEVHGLTREQLRECPRFADIAADFVEFVRGAELIIHNAAFDVGFIDHELARLGPAWGRLSDYCQVVDTLTLAREMHPGQRNSLDALCKRYEIDNAHRALHGALLDAELLAEVYLALTGGQGALGFGVLDARGMVADEPAERAGRERHRALRIIAPTAEECAAHAERLAAIEQASGGRCVWLKLEALSPPS